MISIISTIKKFNFILLDLGYSSNQLDDSKIGLSFKIDSNLNMNYLGGDINAYKIINDYDKEELQRVFYFNGEINQAEKFGEAPEVKNISEKKFFSCTQS